MYGTDSYVTNPNFISQMHQFPPSDQYNLIDDVFGSQDFNSLQLPVGPYRGWAQPSQMQLPQQGRHNPAMTPNTFNYSPGFIPQNMISHSGNGAPIDFHTDYAEIQHNLQNMRLNYYPQPNVFVNSQNVSKNLHIGPQNVGPVVPPNFNNPQNFVSPHQQGQVAPPIDYADIHKHLQSLGPVNFFSSLQQPNQLATVNQTSAHPAGAPTPSQANTGSKPAPLTMETRGFDDSLLTGGMFDNFETIDSHVDSDAFGELEPEEEPQQSPIASVSPRHLPLTAKTNLNKSASATKGKTNSVPGSKVSTVKTQSNGKALSQPVSQTGPVTSVSAPLSKLTPNYTNKTNAKPHSLNATQTQAATPKNHNGKPLKTAPAPDHDLDADASQKPFSWADIARSNVASKKEQSQQSQGPSLVPSLVSSTPVSLPVASASNTLKGQRRNSHSSSVEVEPSEQAVTTSAQPGKPRRRGKGPIPALDCLHDINPPNFPCNPKFAKFFVIKSYSEDDVHKSIKYGIWTSTETGNKRLDKAYRDCASKGPIYLFFSVNSSGQFCGFAEMTSPLDYSKKAECWNEDKWSGQFSVKWRFIKDLPNNQLRHIRLSNNENKPVTNSRDTQEVLHQPGCELLKQFSSYASKSSILDDFQYYNEQEEKEKKLKELALKSKEQLD